MHPEKLQAFVLTSRDYGDSDRIVSLLTLEQGRISAFARGARKSRKRFGAALEPFTRIEALVRLKEQGLSGLTQAEIRSIYPALRNDLARIAQALYACEVIEAICPEGQPLPRIFRLLSAYLDRLQEAGAGHGDRRFFEVNLLNILGYRPALECCSRCGVPFDAADALVTEGGELACRFCAASGRPFSAAARGRLLACLGTGTFGAVSLSDEVLEQAGGLLDQALATQVGRRLRSLDFLTLACGA